LPIPGRTASIVDVASPLAALSNASNGVKLDNIFPTAEFAKSLVLYSNLNLSQNFSNLFLSSFSIVPPFCSFIFVFVISKYGDCGF